MVKFLKTTVMGGVLFLVPIVIFIVFIEKALHITHKLSAPIAAHLNIATLSATVIVELIAIIILVFFCFIAGLAAKTAGAKRFSESLEINVLEKIPAYALLKIKTQSLLKPEDADNMVSVAVQFDDYWQIAYEIERLTDGRVVIFLPGSPDPWAGSVCVVTADRITLLDLPIKSAAILLKKLGKGTTAIWPNSF